MKKTIMLICIQLSLVFLGCNDNNRDNNFSSISQETDEDIVGGKYERFMKDSIVTIPSDENSVILKAVSPFFYITYIKSIQNRDTTKQVIDVNNINGETQVISGDWYSLKTVTETAAYPTAIKVYVNANNTKSQRLLILEIAKGNGSNIITIIQEK